MINKNDIAILSNIAEYRFLTVKQISFLQQRSIPVIRRRLRFFMKEKLISTLERVFVSGPGRNEHVAILSNKGLKLLQSENIINDSLEYISNQTYDSAIIEHDLLLNWFLIHLIQLERTEPRFRISSITPNSQYLFSDKSLQPAGIEILPEYEDPDLDYRMIPDAVFTITDQPSNKSLLFFLEVDRGTEPLTSNAQNSKNIEQKINAYKVLFENRAWKPYKELAGNPLNGFRLLFLTNMVARKNSICQLTRNMPLSNFVWITSEHEMFEKGVSAKIWSRGGNLDKPCESILNEKLAFDSPIVIKK